MKELYLKLIEVFFSNEVKELFAENGLSPIQHIDIFRGQYVQPEAFEPFPTPALFFEYNTFWSDKGRKTQSGDATVRIHIVLEVPAESYSGSSDQAFALSVFDYRDFAHYVLTGIDGSRQTGLQRTSEDPAFSESPLLLPFILTYKCLLSDDTTDVIKKKYSGNEKFESIALTKTTPSLSPEPHIPSVENSYHIE